jgi:DNA-binding beta-propeller fold protein YncE
LALLVAPSPSPSRSFPRFHITAFASLIAILAGLAPDAAHAEVRRRAYLPSAGGVVVQDLNASAPVPPGYTSATPDVLAFTGDGQTMYGVVASTGDLLVYDLNSQNAPTVHALGLTTPFSMVVTPDGKKAYVARGANSISIVNLQTMSVTGSRPYNHTKLAMSPDGAYMYHAGGSTMWKVNTATDSEVVGNGFAVGTIQRLAVSPDGQRAVLTGDGGGGAVAIVDLQTLN